MEHTTHPDAQWFENAGLGLFVHWGLSSVNAEGELSWSMMARGGDDAPVTEDYFEQAERFDPDDYDPDSWLRAASRAGMEYAVLTTKHHDGFVMWPSEYGGFGTAEYVDGRDLVGEYVDACRRHGVKVGFYFSLPDWHHPSWPAEARETYAGLQTFTAETDTARDHGALARLEAYYGDVQGQLRELLTRYGDVDLLWFDTPDYFWSGVNEDRIGDLYGLARRLQPGLVINGRGGYTHWGDYRTPENELPEEPPDGWWELCQTWGDSWGYQADDEYRGLDWTLKRITETVGRGGNLLLNVGPKADGSLDGHVYDRLDALADWMDDHAPAVQSVRGGPWPPRCELPVTRGDATWYVHVPAGHEGDVALRSVPEPRDVRRLGTGDPLEYEHVDGTLSVAVADDRATPSEVVAVSWDGTEDPLDCPGRPHATVGEGRGEPVEPFHRGFAPAGTPRGHGRRGPGDERGRGRGGSHGRGPEPDRRRRGGPRGRHPLDHRSRARRARGGGGPRPSGRRGRGLEERLYARAPTSVSIAGWRAGQRCATTRSSVPVTGRCSTPRPASVRTGRRPDSNSWTSTSRSGTGPST